MFVIFCSFLSGLLASVDCRLGGEVHPAVAGLNSLQTQHLPDNPRVLLAAFGHLAAYEYIAASTRRVVVPESDLFAGPLQTSPPSSVSSEAEVDAVETGKSLEAGSNCSKPSPDSSVAGISPPIRPVADPVAALSTALSTALSRGSFFSVQKPSDLFPQDVRDAIDNAIQYLHRLGFTEEILLRISQENVRARSPEILDVSLGDEGCQDKALYCYRLYQRYGKDWHTCNVLPTNVGLFFALCFLLAEHASVRWGPNSFLGCYMPARPAKLLNMERFPALTPRGSRIKTDFPRAFVSALSVLLSCMVKAEMYPKHILAKAPFKKAEGMDLFTPVLSHADSFINCFLLVNPKDVPCILCLTHFCVANRAVGLHHAEQMRSVEVQAVYEQHPLRISQEEKPAGEIESAGIRAPALFFEVCTYNLSLDERKSVVTTLVCWDVFHRLMMAWAQNTDDMVGSVPNDFNGIISIPLSLTKGKFGLEFLYSVLSRGVPSIGARHVFFGWPNEVSKTLLDYNTNKASGSLAPPKVHIKPVGR